MDDYTKERISDLKQAVDRISSHFDSEVRATVTINKRIDQLEKMVDKHDTVLHNGGKGGLVLIVDRIVQSMERNKNSIAIWLSIASLVAVAVQALFEIINRK